MKIRVINAIPTVNNPARFHQPGSKIVCERTWGQMHIDNGDAEEVTNISEPIEEPEPQMPTNIIIIDDSLINKAKKKSTKKGVKNGNN